VWFVFTVSAFHSGTSILKRCQAYSYIRVLPDGFHWKRLFLRYVNIWISPPPSQLSCLATALNISMRMFACDLTWTTYMQQISTHFMGNSIFFTKPLRSSFAWTHHLSSTISPLYSKRKGRVVIWWGGIFLAKRTNVWNFMNVLRVCSQRDKNFMLT
jgi:hypothetical protein